MKCPLTWSCWSCQSSEYESSPAEWRKISWAEPNRSADAPVPLAEKEPISPESAGTSVTWNELNSTNAAVNALEQFPMVRQWQAPGTSADETRADWRRSLRSGASVYWRRDQKQKGAEDEEEHSTPQTPSRTRERESSIHIWIELMGEYINISWLLTNHFRFLLHYRLAKHFRSG